MHPDLYRKTWIQLCKTKSIVIIVGALIHEIKLAPCCNIIVTIDAEDEDIKNHIGDKFGKISIHQKDRNTYMNQADIIIRNSFDSHFKEECIKIFKSLIKD